MNIMFALESSILNQNGWRDAPGVERPEAGSLPFAHYTQAGLPSDALDAVRACLSHEIASFEFTSSLYAIIARGATLPQSSLQVTLLLVTVNNEKIFFRKLYITARGKFNALPSKISTS
ncbi:unnamed protein product [Cylicostephanus goldi]|uniref:Uncharacterized protein n=1 Tax=Cylicostephanus goldi TaxID=71465 RepID=A0A3P6R9A5_CYLGO|nr:unnamed protein product [Cylicostephanus goldi]